MNGIYQGKVTGVTSIMKKPIAHITEDSREHGLYEHLIATAKKAEHFAAEFGCGEWGYLAGLWHDFGKFSDEFQKKLQDVADAHIETKAERVDHSTAGAIYAVNQFINAGIIFSYLIAGHHAGLPDWQTDTAGRKSLAHRLQNIELLNKLPLKDIPSNGCSPTKMSQSLNNNELRQISLHL